jgi:hypothetical protein
MPGTGLRQLNSQLIQRCVILIKSVSRCPLQDKCTRDQLSSCHGVDPDPCYLFRTVKTIKRLSITTVEPNSHARCQSLASATVGSERTV